MTLFPPLFWSFLHIKLTQLMMFISPPAYLFCSHLKLAGLKLGFGWDEGFGQTIERQVFI